MAFRNEMNREQAGAENKISFTDDLLTVFRRIPKRKSIYCSLLCADKGVELMAIDGNITSRLIAHFTSKNIPILTVHDSYIVEFEYEDELIRIMNDACEKELGITGFKIKSEKKVTPGHYSTTNNKTDQELTLLKATKRSTSKQSCRRL